MYAAILKKHYYCIHINNQIYYFENLEKYIRNKLLVKKVKPSTVKTILSTLNTFIYWTMANPEEQDEDLALYLARFLQNQEEGFEIYNSTYVKDLNENIDFVEISIKAKQPSTIDKDKAIIEDYLKATNQDLFQSYDLDKNIQAYNHKRKHNIGDGYGLKMGKMAQSVLLNDKSIVPSNDKSTQGDIKSFPYELFDALLELANSRERMIYLLAGACSARIGQILNLTRYDIDFNNQQVWLVDPRSSNQLGYHGVSRKRFLKENYHIDATKDKPHVKIGFKAPIPLRFKARHHLFWLSHKYKDLFFETMLDYQPLPESSRIPMHPFTFVTASGARLTPQQVDDAFKTHCKKLKKKYPAFEVQLSGLGLHSLRHMFGVAMASLEALLVINSKTLKYSMDSKQIKIITKEAMGHKSLASTDIYFNRPWNLNIQLGEYINSLYDGLMQTMTSEELEDKYGTKRLTA